MNNSPRWHLDGLPGTTGIVEVMLYADHVAALAEAEQYRDETLAEWKADIEASAVRWALDRAREAVLPLLATLVRHAATRENWEQTDALMRRVAMDIKRALDALKGEQA